MNEMMDYFKKAGWRRSVFCVAGNIPLGLGVALLWLSFLGTPPFDGMNMAMAEVTGISYPLWQIIVNVAFFVIQLIWGRKLIGLGTIVNAFLLGYIVSFFKDVLVRLIPGYLELPLWGRIMALAGGVIFASLGLSLYQTADLGVAPFDALPLILHQRTRKIPYFWCRMMCDSTCALVCFLAGGISKGLLGVGTIVAAFGLGPVIALFNRFLSEKIMPKKAEFS